MENKVYHCPRCNSTKLGYITYADNVYDIYLNNAKPIYVEKFICHNCNYSEYMTCLDNKESKLSFIQKLKILVKKILLYVKVKKDNND
nr:MAG TPA: nucleic-acid-binding protein [Caudoviricetes sp.]